MDRRHLCEISAVVAELSALHSRREAILSKIVTLEARLKELVIANPETDDGIRAPVPAFLDQNRDLPERVTLFLDSDPERDFTADEIQEWLPESNANSIRSALVRLAKHNRIERLERGLYRSLKDR